MPAQSPVPGTGIVRMRRQYDTVVGELEGTPVGKMALPETAGTQRGGS